MNNVLIEVDGNKYRPTDITIERGYFYEHLTVETMLSPENIHLKSSSMIDKVIFNDPATIVYWTDGSKTVVKADDEPFDKEKGLALAISKKFLGNKGNYYNEFKRWLNG